MAPNTPNIPYEQFKPFLAEKFHAGRSILQADLYAVKWDGKDCLLKDFSQRPWFVRGIWGRMVIAREMRAMRRLYGLEGIPKIYAASGPYAILFERLNARRIPRRWKSAPPPLEFFDRLTALVKTVHERGICHGDLRRLNILMDEQYRPYLIDFATAVSQKPGLGGIPFRFLFRIYSVMDLYHIAKIKADFHSESLTKEEGEAIARFPSFLRAARLIKKYVCRLRKPRHLRRMARKLRHRLGLYERNGDRNDRRE